MDEKLELELLEVTGKSSLAIPVAVIAMASLFCYMVSDTLNGWIWGGWLFVIVLFAVARHLAITRIPSLDIPLHTKTVLATGISFFNGIAHGSSVLFFPYFDYSEKILFTLVLGAFSLGAIPTTVGHRTRFLTYSMTVLLPLGLVWLVTDIDEISDLARVAVASMIFVFIGIQMRFASGYFELFTSSFKMREEKKELNARLRKAFNDEVRANESKVRFLAAASHDLRQPIHTLSLLTAAIGFQRLEAPVSDIVVKIEKTVSNLSSLLEGLLDISKLDAGIIEPKPVVFNLSNLLQRLAGEYAPLARSKELTLEVNLGQDHVYMASDPELLERLIRNVLGNSIKYTDEGTVSITLSCQNEVGIFEVADTGKGIRKEEMENIFDEFYQVDNTQRDRSQGLGLGLSIVKRVAEILELEIWLESIYGEGTNFFMEFSTHKTPSKTSKEEPMQSVELVGERILCVDDEPDVLQATQLLLHGLGCDARTANSISEAISIVYSWKPSLVLTDFRLGRGCDGLQLIRELREINGALPALLVSGDTSPERIIQARHAGIPLLTKPVDVDLLKIEISKALLNK